MFAMAGQTAEPNGLYVLEFLDFFFKIQLLEFPFIRYICLWRGGGVPL